MVRRAFLIAAAMVLLLGLLACNLGGLGGQATEEEVAAPETTEMEGGEEVEAPDEEEPQPPDEELPPPPAAHFNDYAGLPDEDGYWEASWYQRGEPVFEPCRALDLTIGVQICTEMWFLEWARHFARADAELLCVPRATPHASVAKWLAGGQAAAVCAGAYCLSSNLWNPPGSKADCGGLGWIISPEGDVLATTNPDSPFATVEIDPEFARHSKSTYPRYVSE